MSLRSVVLAIAAAVHVLPAQPTADNSQVVVTPITSTVFQNTRSLRVYLPAGYASDQTARRYPVMYFNDGFAVFAPRSWNAPRTLDSLIANRIIPPMIVVGIDNAASIPGVQNPVQARTNEFLPYPDSTEPNLPDPQGLRYPEFIVNEVMPLIERSFRVLTGAEHTGIAGSSYGALAALITVTRHPGRFSALILESAPLFLFKQRLITESQKFTNWPAAVYVGVGTGESDDPAVLRLASDNLLERFTNIVRAQSPSSRVKYFVVDGATHSSAAWGARLPVAMTFLYGGR